MDKPASRYAQSQGIRLLATAIQKVGPLFTRRDLRPLAEQMGVSGGQLSNLISALNASGHIAILKRGLYMIRSPLFTGEVHPFAIAAALVQPSAISHWSALAHHGFTTQIPASVQASTPRKIVTPAMRKGETRRPRGRSVWQVLDLEFEYIHVIAPRFFGHQRIWVDAWHQVDITDPERTALDLIARPDVFGRMGAAIEILESALPRLDIARLVTYTLRYGQGATIKRMGWILENLGVADAQTVPLRAYPVTNYYPLDPRGPADGKRNRRWHIKENLQGARHA